MRLAALFSGGKDSTFALHEAVSGGDEIACLITIEPVSAESMLLHHPGIRASSLLAESMGIPQIMGRAVTGSVQDEAGCIRLLAERAASEYGIEGIVHGGIRSVYQKRAFEKACRDAGLVVQAPLWGRDAQRYMRDIISSGLEYMIIAVSAGGLDESWLGRTIDDGTLDELEVLAERHGFNLDFEGGEAETLVLDAPLCSRRLEITESAVSWDGCRGSLEIKAMRLEMPGC